MDSAYLIGGIIFMPSVSIIRSDKPRGPADEGLLRYEKQQKRTDPEAILLKEYYENFPHDGSPELQNEITSQYCEKLEITVPQLFHKIEIFYGIIEDDEHEWREQKYGLYKHK